MAWADESKYAKECEKRGYLYDYKKADKVCRFIETLECTFGKFEYKRIKLIPWQEILLRKTFGTVYKDTGLRVIRRVYCQIAKKNGKTELAGALALYMMAADGENSACVYCAAADKEQASLVYRAAQKMVVRNKALRRTDKNGFPRTKVINSVKRIVYYPTDSIIKVLSSDADTKHGLNVSAAIIDELHAHKKRDLFDVLTTGSGAARDQQLIIVITTAGDDKNSVCYEEYCYAKKVKAGIVKDDAYLPVIFEMDEKDNWQEEKNWYKANPSLGITIKIDDMRDEFNKAKEIPARQSSFRQLRLNQWVSKSDRWLDYDRWIRQGGERIEEKDFYKKRCFGGLDLSSVSDMTAWVKVFPEENGDFNVICNFWCPESRLTDPKNKYREVYKQWHQEGYLETTGGDAIDYEYIKNRIISDSETYNIDSINVDRQFQGYQLTQDLDSAGLKAAGFALSFRNFSVPMKYFEKAYLDGKIKHGNNPVLNWMADNVAVKKDANENKMPDKAESQGKIDGIVALVLALDRVARNEGKYYETAYAKEEFIYI